MKRQNKALQFFSPNVKATKRFSQPPGKRYINAALTQHCIRIESVIAPRNVVFR
jgi:hypothetical protein